MPDTYDERQDLRSPTGRFANFLKASEHWSPGLLLGSHSGGRPEIVVALGDMRDTYADLRQLRQQLAAAIARAGKAEATLARFGIACCACATTDNLGYRNYRDQLLCWPCANGEPRAADATQDGLSATQTDADGVQASREGSNSSATTATLSERCPCGCPRIGDGCNCHFCNEPYPTRQPDDTTEGR